MSRLNDTFTPIRKIVDFKMAGSTLIALSNDGLLFSWEVLTPGQLPEWVALPPLPDTDQLTPATSP